METPYNEAQLLMFIFFGMALAGAMLLAAAILWVRHVLRDIFKPVKLTEWRKQ